MVDFNKKIQSVKLKLNGCTPLYLMVKIKEKLVPYQEENVAGFVNKNKK
ncbi:MAG: hypothetical protein ACI4EF_08030 [Coprococcus sp.]